MEDEGFVEDGYIEEAAWEHVGLYGDMALAVSRRLAALAEQGGDSLTALTWRAIAETVERILHPER